MNADHVYHCARSRPPVWLLLCLGVLVAPPAAAVLTVEVTGDTGEPLPSATLTLLAGDGTEYTPQEPPPAATPSDEETPRGTFVFTGVPEGRHRLVVSDPSLTAPYEREIQCTGEEQTIRISIPSAAFATVPEPRQPEQPSTQDRWTGPGEPELHIGVDLGLSLSGFDDDYLNDAATAFDVEFELGLDDVLYQGLTLQAVAGLTVGGLDTGSNRPLRDVDIFGVRVGGGAELWFPIDDTEFELGLTTSVYGAYVHMEGDRNNTFSDPAVCPLFEWDDSDDAWGIGLDLGPAIRHRPTGLGFEATALLNFYEDGFDYGFPCELTGDAQYGVILKLTWDFQPLNQK